MNLETFHDQLLASQAALITSYQLNVEHARSQLTETRGNQRRYWRRRLWRAEAALRRLED